MLLRYWPCNPRTAAYNAARRTLLAIPLARHAAQRLNLCGQLPRTPLGALFSQYFGALCCSKLQFWQTAARNAARHTLLAILLARCCSKLQVWRTAAHNAARRTLLAILLARYTGQRLKYEKMQRTAKNRQKPKANER